MEFAPLRGKDPFTRPWEGSCEKKPWQYRVTVAIPTLDQPENVGLIVELYKASKEKPFFLLIDTGSTPANLAQLKALRHPDVEVFDLLSNGWQHPSDPVAIAMDLAFSRCPSPYLFATHDDCFPRSREVLPSFVEILQRGFDCVGYQMSPRRVPGWEKLPSHTCTMYNIASMDRIGAGWSLRRWNSLYGKIAQRDQAVAVGWPDTEVLIGQQIVEHGLKWYCVGTEANHVRQVDDRIDHCRSLSSSMLYADQYHRQAAEWIKAARAEARARLDAWRQAIDWTPPRR